MHLQRNFYEVLGLSPAATAVDIKKRYRELARKFHPDLVEDKALGQRIFTQINQAYRTLGDAERRAQYDASLRAPRPKQAGSASAIREPGPIAGASGAAQRATRPTVDIEGLLRRADRAMMQGNSAEAHTLCEAVLKEDPESAPAYSILGDALAQIQKNHEAIAAYRKSLSIAQTSIVQAKLSRLQSITRSQADAAAAAAKTTAAQKPAYSAPTVQPPPAGRGLIGRLLKRK